MPGKIVISHQFDLSRLTEVAELVQSPIVTSASEAEQLSRELSILRRRHHLLALRGGRQTDLTRPLATTLAKRLRDEAPILCQKIREVEHWLANWAPSLLVRTVKYDEARYSSTATGHPSDSNWHFDAGESDIFSWPAAIPQFYLNIAASPRFFRLDPQPLPAMIRAIAQTEHRPVHQVARMTANQVLRRYQSLRPKTPTEQIRVPSGGLMLFDGRRFAHDAGKWPGPNDTGTTGSEPDIVLALDLKSDLLNQIICQTELSFLEDLAS